MSQQSTGSVAFGICLGFALHVLQLPLILVGAWMYPLPKDTSGFAAFAAFRVFIFVYNIGMSQLVYLVPVMLILALARRPLTLKGVCIAGLITTAANLQFQMGLVMPRPESYLR